MSDFLVIFSSVCMHAISVARDRIDLQVPGSRRRIMNEDEEEYDGLSLTLAINFFTNRKGPQTMLKPSGPSRVLL